MKTQVNGASARIRNRIGIALILALVVSVVVSAPTAEAADWIYSPDQASGVARYTAIDVDSAGNPVVAYYDQGNKNLKLLHCGNPNCSSDNSITTAHSTNRDVGSHVAMVLDDADNPIIAYRDATQEDLLVMRCSDPNCTNTKTIERPDDSGDDVGEDISMALNSAGNPVIAYHAITGRDLRIVVCGDPTCEPSGNSKTRPARTGAVGNENSLVLDDQDRPVVAYRDATNQQLAVLRCSNPDCSVTPGTNVITTPDPSTDSHGNFPSVALNAAGNPVVAYYSDGGILKVVVCSNATCAGSQSPKILDNSGDLAFSSMALALDADDNPLVAYRYASAEHLHTVRCWTPDCGGFGLDIFRADGRSAGRGLSMQMTPDFRPVMSYSNTSTDTLNVLTCDDTDCGLPPIVTEDEFMLDEDTVFVQASPNVLSNDFDQEDVFSLTASLVTPPANGQLTLNSDGSMVYTPDADFFGMDSFVYTANDRSHSIEATATFSVRPVNDAPVATDDAVTTPQDVPVTVNVVDGTAGGADTDVEGDVLTVTSITGLTNGTATVSGSTITYTPTSGYVGSDSGTYTVDDGSGGSDTATLAITVTSTATQNSDPVATDDAATTNVDTTASINVIDGSAGGADTDADGDTLTVTGVAGFSNGAATFAGSTITYTPNTGFVGVDDATYTISDGNGGAATATVTVTVAAAGAALCDGKVVTHDMNAGASGMGTAGDDVFLGTPGADTIDGLGGDDTICGEGGDDTIHGGDGLDFIYGGEGNDTMTGGLGNDRIRGQQGVDIIDGNDGNDFLYGGVDGDTINGGDGRDTIGGFGGPDMIDGGPGNDNIFGGFGPDIISGGDGNDKILGLVGNDIIDGGDGNDTLNGDNGQDTINGGNGNDVIKGGNSLDTLFGDAGNDTVSGGKSDDTLSGGSGTDTCTGNTETVADTADATCETIFGVP